MQKFFSDLNTDDDLDEARKRRREYAHKHIISSSEEDDPLPRKKSRLPPFPRITSSQCQKNEHATTSESAPSPVVCNETVLNTASSKCSELSACNRGDPEKPFQDMVLRMLVDLKHKLNAVIVTQRDVLQKLEGTRFCEPQEENETIETVLNEFPLETEDQLQTLEQKVKNDAKFRECMLKELSKIGGGDIKTITKRLLELIFKNQSAVTYSYVGGKKKKVFANLQLCKVIQVITRRHIQSATDDDIAICIKAWLRHAKERLEREQKTKTRLQPQVEESNE